MATWKAAPLEKRQSAARIMKEAWENLARNRLVLASVFAQGALKQVPEHPAALFCLGVIALEGKRPELARGVLERALANDPPERVNVAMALALAQHQCGDVESALATLDGIPAAERTPQVTHNRALLSGELSRP